jgi:hypothetical protein
MILPVAAKTMKATAIVLTTALLGLNLRAEAQTPVPAPSKAPVVGVTAPPAVDLTPILPQLRQIAGAMGLDVSRLRIEKWKADASVKKQSQTDADSITRNLTTALPTLIDQVGTNPRSLAAAVKLYRNVNALYDVFGTLTEMAGTFGPKAEYTRLASDADKLDGIRRDVGDKLEKLAAATDSEIMRLRAEAAKTPPPAPVKIVIDDEEKPKKTVHKKPVQTKKPAENKPSEAKSSDNANPSPAVTK